MFIQIEWIKWAKSVIILKIVKWNERDGDRHKAGETSSVWVQNEGEREREKTGIEMMVDIWLQIEWQFWCFGFCVSLSLSFQISS